MDILQRIIDMDKAAAARAEAALVEERRLSDETGEGSAKSREEAVAAERAKVEEFCEKQEVIVREKLSKADKTRAEECGKLDEKFAANKQWWKVEVIKRITEG